MTLWLFVLGWIACWQLAAGMLYWHVIGRTKMAYTLVDLITARGVRR